LADRARRGLARLALLVRLVQTWLRWGMSCWCHLMSVAVVIMGAMCIEMWSANCSIRRAGGVGEVQMDVQIYGEL
jgi:hypothetical protein